MLAQCTSLVLGREGCEGVRIRVLAKREPFSTAGRSTVWTATLSPSSEKGFCRLRGVLGKQHSCEGDEEKNPNAMPTVSSFATFWIIAIALCAAFIDESSGSVRSQVSKSKVSKVPVLSPTIHAAILEAPLRTAEKDDDTESGGFFGRIKNQLANLFNHTSSHNATKSNGEDAAAGNDTSLNSSSAQNKTKLFQEDDSTDGRNETTARSGLKANGATSKPLKTSTADAVTAEMRLTSFIEGISASLEDMRFAILRAFWNHKKNSYEIKSRNETMLVAHIDGKRFFSPDGSHKVKPVRVVSHNRKLTVEVEEAAFEEIKDESKKVAEETTGMGTEYEFVINDCHAVLEDIYLKATNGVTPGYDIIIPLRPKSAKGSDDAVTAISRTVTKATSPDIEVQKGHWGTSREEDEFEFLQAQLSCQKAHGYSGIRRMLCTCERVHLGSETRHLLCVSRIADKVVRVAKENGEGRAAARIYRGSMRCRSAKYGVRGSHSCLVSLLEKHAGKGSELQLKYGRSILSSEDDKSDKKVDDILAKEKVQAKELIGAETADGDIVKEKSSMMQVVMFTVYIIGIIFLLICLFDVSLQYRRHNENSRGGGRLLLLPERAQALYARLGMRTE